MKKFINKVSSLATKACVYLTTLFASALCMADPAYAVTINSNPPDFNVAAGKLIDTVLSIMKVGGVMLAIFGIYQFVIAMTQEQPDRKMPGIICIASGIILVGIEWFLKQVGILV